MISYTLRASAFLFLQKPFFSLSFWSSELHQYSHYTFQTTCKSLPTIKGKSVFLRDQTCSLRPMASSFSSVSEQNDPMSMVTQDLNRTQHKSPPEKHPQTRDSGFPRVTINQIWETAVKDQQTYKRATMCMRFS